MSEDAVKKASVNKNIKKLRAVSMVCGLTRGWQQWVSENEEKQSSEPSGWAPSYPGEPKDTKKDTGKSKVSSKTHSDPSQDDPETRIRTGHVVKTVSRDVQERSAGIDFLTKRICKDSSVDELDRMLSGKGSPTRRRKCSNMVSELRRSWKELEQADGETEGSEERDDAGTVKRSSLMGSNKDVDEANKINALSQKYSAVGNLKSRWQNWASEHTINQKLNPFSEDFDYEYSMSTRLRKGEEGYGRPKEGSKTAERAKRAEKHIHREIDDMCFVIRTMAEADPDGRTRVTFGELFDRYVRISDKVVGILMRARKHGKVAFEGEMLWQGQDDEVIITLLI